MYASQIPANYHHFCVRANVSAETLITDVKSRPLRKSTPISKPYLSLSSSSSIHQFIAERRSESPGDSLYNRRHLQIINPSASLSTLFLASAARKSAFGWLSWEDASVWESLSDKCWSSANSVIVLTHSTSTTELTWWWPTICCTLTQGTSIMGVR